MDACNYDLLHTLIIYIYNWFFQWLMVHQRREPDGLQTFIDRICPDSQPGDALITLVFMNLRRGGTGLLFTLYLRACFPSVIYFIYSALILVEGVMPNNKYLLLRVQISMNSFPYYTTRITFWTNKMVRENLSMSLVDSRFQHVARAAPLHRKSV